MRHEPLSIAGNNGFGSNDYDDNDDNDDNGGLQTEDDQPSRRQIVEFIKTSCPDLIVRPADLSREFGFSINDASAELCGLLQLVGAGATFRFEDASGGTKSMVYQFPVGFQRRVLFVAGARDTFRVWATICIKTLKVVTALGLIVSIAIVSIAMVAALVFVYIAFSKGMDTRNPIRNSVSRQLRTLIMAFRQLLFCFVMFGPSETNTATSSTYENNFFRESAYDVLLMLNFCYSSPSSLFFWWRATHLRQRYRHRGSRFGGFRTSNQNESGIEGVNLLSRGDWSDVSNNDSSSSNNNTQQQGNLVSSLVIFLFGSAATGISNSDKWKLRSAIILSKTNDDGGIRPISLRELAPFTDSPPSSPDDTVKVIAEGLSIVAYFNGIPYDASNSNNNGIGNGNPAVPAAQLQEDSKQRSESGSCDALFLFPELISESSLGVRRDDYWGHTSGADDETNPGGRWWTNFFYRNDPPRTYGSNTADAMLPTHLHEPLETFSTISRLHFFVCLLAIAANFAGVVWLSRSLEPSEILGQNLGEFGVLLKLRLVPVMRFYARLFVVIPTGRLAYVMVHNQLCKRRNRTRKTFASQLVQ